MLYNILMAKEKIYVINARGERELFSKKKVYRSCRRIGASPSLADEIASHIAKRVYPEIPTSEIFEWVKQSLSGTSFQSGIKFSLKKAMQKLGPGGFDFEKYVAEIFSQNGFEVEINQYVPGKCVEDHEIDFIAKAKRVAYIGECKYHHQPGKRVDLKVGLADYAKFLDISKGKHFKKTKIKPMIVTNTKFTSQLKQYAECMGIELLGWKYPKRKGLERMIEKQDLYPITILPSFKRYLKKIFAKQRMMLALELLETTPKRLSNKTQIPLEIAKKLTEEAEVLLEK